jgi:hypothetical protein
MGKLGPLSKGEIEKCAAVSLAPRTMARAWEYWVRRLEQAAHMKGVHLPRHRDDDERPEPAKLISRDAPDGDKQATKKR